MKIAALSATALALAGAVATATPSMAHDYPGYAYGYGGPDPCSVQQHDSGTAGAVLGGLAGALLGSSLAGHHARGGGVAIGAVAGAVIGNNIARSNARSSDACRARDYGDVSWRGAAPYGGGYYRSNYRPYGYGYDGDDRYEGYSPYGN
jgi:hypothetical protein